MISSRFFYVVIFVLQRIIRQLVPMHIPVSHLYGKKVSATRFTQSQQLSSRLLIYFYFIHKNTSSVFNTWWYLIKSFHLYILCGDWRKTKCNFSLVIPLII